MMKTFDSEKVKTLLRELVATPSVNPSCLKDPSMKTLTCEKSVSEYIVAWASSKGIPCEVVEPVKNRPCVILTVGPEGKTAVPVLACFAHMDTVWTPGMESPFELKERTGLLWGLGSADDKGSITAGLLAIEAYKDSTEKPCIFKMVCTCDEEVGFTGISHLVPNILHPDAVIILEGTDLDIVTAHKGDVRYSVKTTGESVHSSLVPAGRNAIYQACKQVLELEKLSGELLARKRHPILGSPTLNVGTICGGTQANSVPDLCTFVIDRRMLPCENVQTVRSEISAALEKAGFNYQISEPLFMSGPFEIHETHPMIRFMAEHVRKVNPCLKIKGLNCATEAAVTCAAGIPTIVFGPGSISVAHAINEHIDPLQIEKAASVLCSIAENFSFFYNIK